MRVAIITPAAPAHHQHFCAHLAERHEVVGVIHPAPRASSVCGQLRKMRRQFAHGVTYGTLRTLAAVGNPLIGWNWREALDAAETRFFPEAAAAYERAGVPAVARRVADVNGDETISLVRKLAPDAVLCLGGPVYRKPLIDACGTMINFHSGVSPVYNGASTIMFAFANGHVHLCGGTLMTMSSVVDGGDIMAHYLPAIEPGDDPATLFMKTVHGAADVCSRFLDHVARAGSFTKVPQTPPLFHCTSEGWTVHHTQRIRRHLELGTAARHLRPEQVRPYWALGSDGEARDRVRETISGLLQLA
jgi:folate-dependent phosphoribosylglycinamide formyltransferase PurN